MAADIMAGKENTDTYSTVFHKTDESFPKYNIPGGGGQADKQQDELKGYRCEKHDAPQIKQFHGIYILGFSDVPAFAYKQDEKRNTDSVRQDCHDDGQSGYALKAGCVGDIKSENVLEYEEGECG